MVRESESPYSNVAWDSLALPLLVALLSDMPGGVAALLWPQSAPSGPRRSNLYLRSSIESDGRSRAQWYHSSLKPRK
jgi:hypothetical protein